MKTLNLILAGVVLMGALTTQSCKKEDASNEEETTETSVIPTSFNVDVPDAISSESATKSKSKGDTLSGGDIYGHIRTFIHVGDQAGKVVSGIIYAITKHNINKAMVVSFTSDDDGRAKELTVVENTVFEGTTWQFGLTIIDKELAGAADGGKALQVFWNTKPIKGIAILKPINIDKIRNVVIADAMYRVDYSEAGENGYDKQMVVSISGLPVLNPLVDPYSMSGMKMFAGQKGTIVDVYGNSNHPNARFFTADAGFNYAFTASADAATQLGVAEVALPASTLDASSRALILDSASVKNVFTKQIHNQFPGLPQMYINAYLHNTDAPGYFNKSGFVQAGVAPSNSYSTITPRIASLVPFNPKMVSQLNVVFAGK